MKPKISIIVFPGSNCERDVMLATSEVTGYQPSMIWHKETELNSPDLVILPGGFSYGDYLRSGAIAAKSNIMDSVLDHASKGGAVLGICNGFQILLETQMLPGTLMSNSELKYVCRDVKLEITNTNSIFTKDYNIGDQLTMPVAHGEGNYYIEKEELQKLENNGNIAMRYVPSDIEGAYNPNGSVGDIAAITSSNGRIMGMMPHPERVMRKWTESDKNGKVTEHQEVGVTFFQNLIEELV